MKIDRPAVYEPGMIVVRAMLTPLTYSTTSPLSVEIATWFHTNGESTLRCTPTRNVFIWKYVLEPSWKNCQSKGAASATADEREMIVPKFVLDVP
jgi:hypothetical protein